jgi:hypothetical protein
MLTTEWLDELAETSKRGYRLDSPWEGNVALHCTVVGALIDAARESVARQECEALLPEVERIGVALICSRREPRVEGGTTMPYSARLWRGGRVIVSREGPTPHGSLPCAP